MEVLIRFNVENEEEYLGIMEGSILPEEVWELYDSKDGLVRRDSQNNRETKK